MRHAAHKAAKVSNERFSVAKALFTSSRGSHTAKAVRMVQLANGGGAVVGLEPAVAEKLNEVAPMSRRAMREAARAAVAPHSWLPHRWLRWLAPRPLPWRSASRMRLK